MLVDRRCELPLPLVAAVQVDERGPCGAVPHSLHQLSQVGPGVGDQDIAGMAQVMQVGSGWSRLLDRRQPYTLAEVAAMERRACRLVKIRSVGAGPTDAFICSAISFAMMSGMMTTRRLAAYFGGPKAWPLAAD